MVKDSWRPGDHPAEHELLELVNGDRLVALVCFERDPRHCHRTLVAAAVAELRPVRVRELYPLDPSP